ncbi:hypothetical protein IAH82_002982 [Escherichia coli]|nr:hypothetical protein [Escherichia coli]
MFIRKSRHNEICEELRNHIIMQDWKLERFDLAYDACGHAAGLHPGNAPALRRAAATAQHHAAGAATVYTLNAGRTCAAVRPCLRSRTGI